MYFLKMTQMLRAGVLALFLWGVTSSSEAAVSSNTVPNDTIIRLHWIGKRNISTNAAGLMKIWDAPESRTLESQTIDKLAAWPWKLLRSQTDLASTNLLRTLVEDVGREESFMEIRKGKNFSEEMVLAIRLNNERAAVWRTNLATVLHSLTGISLKEDSAGSRWVLKKHHAPNVIEYVRKGEWVVVGAALDNNALLDEVLARIEREHVPYRAVQAKSLLEGEIDLARVMSDAAAQWNLPTALPKFSFSVEAGGRDVLTRGKIMFADAFPMTLDRWNVPTNFMSDDVSSFTAARGIGPWLLSKLWGRFETHAPPNQFYCWSEIGVPMESYCAAPFADSSNAVSRLSDFVLEKGSNWFATHEMVKFQKAKTYEGLEWVGVPYVAPFLKTAETENGDFILAGFFSLVLTNQPQQRLLREFQEKTNLVYYDWEQTGLRSEQWMYLMQLVRVVSDRPQLPVGSAASQWLQATYKKMEQCSTKIVRDNDREFSLTRSSSSGFTAFELHLLMGWLESPDFPSKDGFGVFHQNAPAN